MVNDFLGDLWQVAARGADGVAQLAGRHGGTMTLGGGGHGGTRVADTTTRGAVRAGKAGNTLQRPR